MKEYFKQILFSSLTPFLFLVFLELAASLFLPPAKTFMISTQPVTGRTASPFLSVFSPAAEGLYHVTPAGLRMKKKFEASIKNHFVSKLDVRIKTNSPGFRFGAIGKKQEQDTMKKQ